MDKYSGKRGGNELLVSRKGSSMMMRGISNNKDQNPRLCNRIGCCGSVHSPKVNHVGCSQKAKSSRLSSIGSTSRPTSARSGSRITLPNSHSSVTSSTVGQSEVPEPLPSTGKSQPGVQPESLDAGKNTVAASEVGSSSVGRSVRTRGTLQQKLGNRDTPSGNKGSRTSVIVLRDLGCNHAADVVPSGSSPSDSNPARRKDVVKKRFSEGESSSSSSSKGKKISGLSPEGCNTSTSTNRIADSRQARNGLQQRDNNTPSVRTRRPVSGYTRGRTVAGLGSVNNLQRNNSNAPSSQISQTDAPANLMAHSSSHQFSTQTSFPHTSPFNWSSSRNESLQGARPSSPIDVGYERALLNRDSSRRYNMEGIAEVLLALDRIEQDEELTYEQLLVLETNLFLNGLNFYDQHREMRLDIDNMSYEELLALEDKMGSVSTALSEEALSECIKTSIHHSARKDEVNATAGDMKDDVKCSICQEEYADGDKLGRLPCDHQYHVVCAQQWLRLKNWCPICKASAANSSLLSQPAT